MKMEMKQIVEMLAKMQERMDADQEDRKDGQEQMKREMWTKWKLTENAC
jgi:hypothetical protein